MKWEKVFATKFSDFATKYSYYSRKFATKFSPYFLALRGPPKSVLAPEFRPLSSREMLKLTARKTWSETKSNQTACFRGLQVVSPPSPCSRQQLRSFPLRLKPFRPRLQILLADTFKSNELNLFTCTHTHKHNN